MSTGTVAKGKDAPALTPEPNPPEVLTASKTADNDPLYRILKPCHWKAFAAGEFHRRSEFGLKLAFEVEDPISGRQVPHKDWRHLKDDDARRAEMERQIDQVIDRLVGLKSIEPAVII